MKIVRKALIFSVCLVLMGFMATASASAPETGELPRISGSNRYETAVAVSQQGWVSSEVVVLARGDDFADALAGVPLAFAYEAPVLLTNSQRLSNSTREEILRLGVRKVVLLGGEGAIGTDVSDELVGMGMEIERIHGANRFETAANIAEHPLLSGSATVVLANGMDYPDALAAASYAARNGYPILLTRVGSLPPSTQVALGQRDCIVAGGEAAVGQAVFDSLPGNPVRVHGSNRAATSVALAEHFQPSAGHMYVATGLGFADALSGAVLAAREDSGLLLVTTVVSGSVRDYLIQGTPDLVVLGGTGTVSSDVEERLIGILNYVGVNVEFVRASFLSLSPGGDPVRFPYKEHVAEVLDSSGDYLKIRFGSQLGWVPKEDIVPTSKEKDYIRLTWNFTSASDFVPEPPNASGYNVYSPISHSITRNSDGSYRLGAHTGLNSSIPTARAQGYQVWMTVQQLTSSPGFNDYLADQVIAEALRLDVDGINIDFEGFGSADKDNFTEFVRKVWERTREHNLIISVDVNEQNYDRKELAKVSDYIILMAYDEHWSSCPVEGSVASHPWTRRLVERLLAEVPAEKIILGIPFYNRNWTLEGAIYASEDSVMATAPNGVRVRTEPSTAGGTIFTATYKQVLKYADTVQGENINGDTTWYKVDLGADGFGYMSGYFTEFIAAGDYVGAESVSGNTHYSYRVVTEMVLNFDPVTMTSYWLTTSGETRQMNNVVIAYDSVSEQNVLTYTNGEGVLNKIWLEDVESLQKRVALMHDLDLRGLAAWSINWMDGERRLWNYIFEK